MRRRLGDYEITGLLGRQHAVAANVFDGGATGGNRRRPSQPEPRERPACLGRRLGDYEITGLLGRQHTVAANVFDGGATGVTPQTSRPPDTSRCLGVDQGGSSTLAYGRDG